MPVLRLQSFALLRNPASHAEVYGALLCLSHGRIVPNRKSGNPGGQGRIRPTRWNNLIKSFVLR
jgi:hypothetical protein